MLIPRKGRLEVYNYLFKEGVICAKDDYNLPKHQQVDVPNIYVIKCLESLTSRGYTRENYNWGWYYWYLTNEGIEYLREYLNLPENIIPATLRKLRPAAAPTPFRRGGDSERRGGFGGDRGGRRDYGDKKEGGPPRDFKPDYRDGGGERGGRGGFRGGRGGYRRDEGGDGGFRGGRGGFRGGRGGFNRDGGAPPAQN